jgi:hypothetical protein
VPAEADEAEPDERQKYQTARDPLKPVPPGRTPCNLERHRLQANFLSELRVAENRLEPSFQSVRGIFAEGTPAFEGSGIRLKSHIQIAVRDPSCILGYFRPSSPP